METVTAPSSTDASHSPPLREPSLDTRTLRRTVLGAVVAFGLMARVLTFQAPLFDLHAWRQADTATVARNFAVERFNPLYPQVDYRGSQPDGYVETGLSSMPLLSPALLECLDSQQSPGGYSSAFFFPITALLLHRFIAERYGRDAGLIGLSVYALGLPLTLYIDRAFMNESLLTLLSVGTLRSTQQYLRGGQRWQLSLLALGTTLIAVVKPTYLIVWAPIAGLFAERYGTRFFFRAELWLVGIVNLAALGAWFAHAHSLFEMTGLTFGIGDKLFDRDLLLSWKYAAKMSTRLVKDVLGPFGVVFLVAGVWSAWQRRKVAEIAGICAFISYLVVVTGGNFHHNYYQLPVVPIATVLISLGILDGGRRLAARYRNATPMYAVCSIMVASMVLTTFARSVSFHSWYEIDPEIVYLCNETRMDLQPTERVVIVGSKSPALLFC